MNLSRNELVAILKMAKSMAKADNRIESSEALIIVNELGRFGVDSTMVDEVLAESEKMTYSEAISIISSLPEFEKKYVCSYLATIMASDLDVDPAEITLWRHISELCNLPKMKLMEAINFMQDFETSFVDKK